MAPDEHLSRISTHWSKLFRAHQGDAPDRRAAQEELLERYLVPIYRYICSVVHDLDAVEDLCQEFALRFIRGDFHRAHPDRGRFRNYVKTTIGHLIIDWWRKQGLQAQHLDSARLAGQASPEFDPMHHFVGWWRADLIEAAWKRLAAYDRERQGRWLFAALRYLAEHPEQTGADLAAELGRQLNLSLTEGSVWQTVRRARLKFAAFLLEEVARSIGSSAPEDLRDEVTELGLQRYCEPALAQRGPP
jgi:RNA polymerase sigma-70 factor (ECF subfamily)